MAAFPQIVAISENVWGSAFEQLSQQFDVRFEPEAWRSEQALVELVGPAQALIVRNQTRVDRALMVRAPALLVVGRAGVGLDNIDVPASDDLGIVISAARNANARSVAEHALALALALARDLVGHDRRVRGGAWQRTSGTELEGLCWGVVGLGATGRSTVDLVSRFGMQTVGYDPYLPAEWSVRGLDRRASSIDGVLDRSDVVSLHVPLDSTTRHFVNATFFARMRPGALFVNVGRGGLVDEVALIESLSSGHLGGAGLDVREFEPPNIGELEHDERVLFTPHVAGLTGAAQERVTEVLAADVRAVLGGGCAAAAVGRSRSGRLIR